MDTEQGGQGVIGRSIRAAMKFNGLALAAFGAFGIFAVAQSVFGWQVRTTNWWRPAPPRRATGTT
jgi:hypothetical protein